LSASVLPLLQTDVAGQPGGDGFDGMIGNACDDGSQVGGRIAALSLALSIRV
jgi:hypothetical protein